LAGGQQADKPDSVLQVIIYLVLPLGNASLVRLSGRRLMAFQSGIAAGRIAALRCCGRPLLTGERFTLLVSVALTVCFVKQRRLSPPTVPSAVRTFLSQSVDWPRSPLSAGNQQLYYIIFPQLSG